MSDFMGNGAIASVTLAFIESCPEDTFGGPWRRDGRAFSWGHPPLPKIIQREAKWLPAVVSDTRGPNDRSGVLGKQMAVLHARKHAHAHGHAHLHHHHAAAKLLHTAFSFRLFFVVGIVHPEGASVNRVFHILSFFLKKKNLSPRALWIGQGFFAFQGTHSQKNNGNSPENMVYCLYLWKIEVGSWIENFPAL